MGFRSIFIAAILLALAACGGGGGGNSNDSAITLTLNPSTISATFPGNNQSLSIPGVDVTATVSPAITSSVYVYIVDSAGVLVQGATTITSNSNGSYTVRINFNKSLSPGTYTGNFTIRLCKDSACASEYALNGGRVPYTVTVTPGIQIVSATVNGVSVSPTSLNVRDGDVVTLQSNVPVGWTTAQSGVIVSNESSSSTLWSATLGYGLSTPGGTAQLSVYATTQATPTAQKVTQIFLTQ